MVQWLVAVSATSFESISRGQLVWHLRAAIFPIGVISQTALSCRSYVRVKEVCSISDVREAERQMARDGNHKAQFATNFTYFFFGFSNSNCSMEALLTFALVSL